MLRDTILAFRPTNAEQNAVLQQWRVQYPNEWYARPALYGPTFRDPSRRSFLDWLQHAASAAVGIGSSPNVDATQDYTRLFPHRWAAIDAPLNAFTGGWLYGLPPTRNLMMSRIVAAYKSSPGPQSGNVTAGGTRMWWPYGINSLGKSFY